MTTSDAAAAFAAFREAVLDDHMLAARLRRPPDSGTFAAQAIAAGADRGFVFDEAAVLRVLREGECAWLAAGPETR